MIQILGLRDYLDSKTNTVKKAERFFDKNWRAKSVPDLLENIDKYVSVIPEDERKNIYFTVAECFEEKGRKLKEQSILPIDIDDVELSRIDETLEAVLHTLRVSRSKIGIIYSGNGIQLFLSLKSSITDTGFFDKYRIHYRALCDKIDLELKSRGLAGSADPSVFSPARLMRLPNTKNIKPDRPERQATLVNAKIEKIGFDLEVSSELPLVSKEDQISSIVLDRYPKPDTATVLKECEFIKRCKAEPETLPEPQWYSLLSILGRLDNGEKLSQEYSQGHKGYTPGNTALKLKQSMEASGPRTCKNIDSQWAKCSSCVHFGTKLVSPIMIRGPNYIKTQGTGFHEQKIDGNGNPVPGKPNYEDLRRYFEQKHHYFSSYETNIVYKFIGTHWVEVHEGELTAFATTHFLPIADNKKRAEFVGLMKTTNKKSEEWVTNSTNVKMNFANGVLDLETGKFGPHDPSICFRYVLSYNYDPYAECPKFEKFINEICEDNQEFIDVFLEFLGYSFSSSSCWAQKAILLVGEGSNGKSTLIELIKKMAGSDNHSSLMLSDLKDPANRYDLEGKLFNLAEETSKTSLADSAIFKNLVTGGETMVKRLYSQPFKMRNKAKLIFSCNEYPESADTTVSLPRRLLIIPFKASFLNGNRNPHMGEELLEELSGIFNLAIMGYKRLVKQGDFSIGESIKKEVSRYVENNDPIRGFSIECFQTFDINNDEFYTEAESCERVFEKYGNWCNENNEIKLSSKEFFNRLRNIIPDYAKRSDRQSIGGIQKRVIKGIRFLTAFTLIKREDNTDFPFGKNVQ